MGLSRRVQTSTDASNFVPVLFKSDQSAPGRWNRPGARNKAVDALLDHAQGVHLKAGMPLFRPVVSDVAPPTTQSFRHHPMWGFVHQDWNPT